MLEMVLAIFSSILELTTKNGWQSLEMVADTIQLVVWRILKWSDMLLFITQESGIWDASVSLLSTLSTIVGDLKAALVALDVDGQNE